MAKTMINEPKAADTSYAVVQYGQNVVIRAHLDSSRSDEETINIVNTLRWFEEGMALPNGIKTAGEMLEGEGRVNAKKVLVVLSSGPIAASKNALKDVVDPLEEKGIKLISVVLGDTVDPKLDVIKTVVAPKKSEKDPSAPVKEETFKGVVIDTNVTVLLKYIVILCVKF